MQKNKIVKRMVSIFKKMDTDQFINAHFLCRMAVESLDIVYDWRDYEERWSFYNEFHEERKKQKIRIKRIKHHGETIGTPPNCDYFARCGKKTNRQIEYEAALKRYKKKFKELPHLGNDICDAVLKPREQITKILNRAVDRGTKTKDINLYRNAWLRKEPNNEH